MPQNAEGIRIDPPVSLPSASGTSSAASATAEPPLEPPEIRAGVPGVAGGAHRVVDRADPPGELVRLGLPDHDRALRARAPHRLGVARRDVVGEHRRAVRRPQPGGVVEILDPERDAVERGRAARRAGSAPVERRRLGARALETERREGAEQRVQRLDARGERLDRLERGERARAVAREQLDGREVLELGTR